MRWGAKNTVAAKLARRCEARVAYATGIPEPVSVMVETFGTHTVPEAAIEHAVREVFDLRPLKLIDALKLRNPIYRPTAAYGHFRRPPERRRFVDPDVGQEAEVVTLERTHRLDG